jgi:hypothetical protein
LLIVAIGYIGVGQKVMGRQHADGALTVDHQGTRLTLSEPGTKPPTPVPRKRIPEQSAMETRRRTIHAKPAWRSDQENLLFPPIGAGSAKQKRRAG